MRKIALLFALVMLVAPPAVQALSVSELQAQIQTLLAQLDTLKQQLGVMQAAETTATSPRRDVVDPTSHPICRRGFSGGLSLGSQGVAVTELQGFLKSEGVFSADATGYFGPRTELALKDWQSKNGVVSSGSSETTGYGVAGRRTWDVIGQRCRPQGGGFAATPTSGNAPLVVTFQARGLAMTWTDSTGATVSIADGSDRYVDFGDGTTAQKLTCTNATARECPVTLSHTYSAIGSYQARLIEKGGYPGPYGATPEFVVGSISIRVGSSNPISCTAQYLPVCGIPKRCEYSLLRTSLDECINGKTYGNGCALTEDGATLKYEGECKKPTTICPQYSPPLCENGTLVHGGYASNGCVLAPRCEVTAVGTPSITGFSGPTTLAVGQTGTWSVTATDPNSLQLSYSIDWGENNQNFLASGTYGAEDRGLQQTTFTHSYANSGTYKVTITVTNTSGQTAKTTATVVVGSGVANCTAEYMPVCGQKTVCSSTMSCPGGFLSNGTCSSTCTTQLKTYSNRCIMTADGAVQYSSVACGQQETAAGVNLSI